MDSCSIPRLVLITMATVPCLFSGPPLSETPLFLTPYIEAGHITEAVEACKVVDPGDNTGYGASIPHSYAGLLTVNKTLGNHLFFWYFPSQEQLTAPLLIWFNGGPGSSSMLGVLWENGPIQPLNGAGNTDKFEARHGSWVGPFSMLYIDNPVFVGYSFSDSGPRVTQEEYGEDLFEFVRQFYQLFPHLLSTDLYIGGQSYAGKYIPVLAHRIHSSCEEGWACFPMKGIYIGGPLFAPELMFPENFEYLYNVGVVSKSQRAKGREDTQELIDKYLCGELSPEETIRKIMPIIFEPRIPSYDNYVTGESPDKDRLKLIMTSERMRRALHVGNLDFEMNNKTLFEYFHRDIMSSTRDKLGALLDSGKYKVLIYSGDSDVVVSVAMVEAGLLGLEWRGQQAYQVAGRKFWYGPPGPGAPRPLYGYYSLTGELCRVVVRGAGHQTPCDQLDISREMMIQFVNGGCVVSSR